MSDAVLERLIQEVVALRARVNALEVLEAPAPISDHGALSGLGDDDHTQYLTTGRGDARYLGLTAKAADSDKLDGYHAGNSSGRVPVSNGTVNTNLNADLVDGAHAGTSANQVLKLDANARVPVGNMSLPDMCLVYNTANPVATNNALTIIPFNQTVVEIGSSTQHDPTTNNTRIYCRRAGWYRIGWAIAIQADANGRRVLHVLRNGTTSGATIAQDSRLPVPTESTGFTGEFLYELNSGDYVSLAISVQGASGNLTIHTWGWCPRFWIRYEGPS